MSLHEWRQLLVALFALFVALIAGILLARYAHATENCAFLESVLQHKEHEVHHG